MDAISLLLDVALLALLVVTALAAVEVRNLLGASMFLAIYSLLMALLWVDLQAADVALTEAAVGAGVSTILLIGCIVFVGRQEKRARRVHWPAIVVVALTGGILVYGTADMPAFGDPQAPANRHVAPRYIEGALPETGVPNIVTAVLASYRGFDTLFETVVIFTAGVGVILLLRGKDGRRP